MSLPLVCICVPCYNNENTIKNTLDSIVDQDYSNLIIKVFDNASNDRTCEIVESYFSCSRSVSLIKRIKNVPGEINFNSCIKESEGDYIGIFHADDVYEKNIVSEQLKFFQEHEEVGFVSTHASTINQNNYFLKERFVPPELSKSDVSELPSKRFIELCFKYGNFVTCPSVLFKTKTLKKLNQHFQRELYGTSSDLDLWFRLSSLSNFGFINKPLIRYRKSNVSYSYNLSRTRTQDHELFLVLNNYINNIKDQEEQKKKLIQYRDFLLMKDRANTNISKILLGYKNFERIDLLKNMKLTLKSKFHLKYFFIACAVKFIVPIKSIGKFSKIINFLRFRND